MKTKTAILILAAGSSSRMRQSKQLLKWKNTTLIENIIQQSLNSKTEKVFVVLGANSEKIKSEISLKGITFIENISWQKGIGNSIACGIRYIENNAPEITSVLITLADQPFITSTYFNELLNSFSSSEKRIVATKIKNRVGVPAIFDSFYFKNLKELNEDKGAKKIINLNLNDTEVISSNIDFSDIDTIQDYKKFKE